MADLPTGTVTFLMTDIEGSTRLWEEQPQAMPEAIACHEAVISESVSQNGGTVLKSRGEGDSVFAIFPRAADAVRAALSVQLGLEKIDLQSGIRLRVRCAVHTGECSERDGDFYGAEVNRCARIRSAAHGGQVLISSAAAQLVIRGLPTDLRLIDLGLHRLKDLLQSERLFQLAHPQLPNEFPLLRSLNGIPNNLPIQLTSFIGRRAEVQHIAESVMLHRFVTLTGPGGSGKTRLGLQCAAEVAEQFPGGVTFVDLTTVSGNEQVSIAVARALGLDPVQNALDDICRAMSESKALLLLDNCEHVADGVARFLVSLASQTQSVHFLATSREALRIPGELDIQVPPLVAPSHDITDPQELLQFDAVRLFCERACLKDSHFVLDHRNSESVCQLVRLLDGIPLAIEHAASHAAAFTPQQMLSKLSQRFRLLKTDSREIAPRHRTLKATIDWSFDLLSSEEQDAFRCFGVFAGGCILAAFEQVSKYFGFDEEEAGDLLQSLIGKSLVIAWSADGLDNRYGCLETIREYATEKLGTHEEPLRKLHLAYFLALAEETSEVLDGPEAGRLFRLLESEENNLRTALDFACGSKDPRALDLASALRKFWLRMGLFEWGRDSLRAALDCAESPPPEQLGTALNALGALEWRLGNFREALSVLEQCLQIWEDLGDLSSTAAVRHNLGLLSITVEDPEQARTHLSESLAIYDQANDLAGHGKVLQSLGNFELVQDNPSEGVLLLERAVRDLEDSGEIVRAIGARSSLADALAAVGRTNEAILAIKNCLLFWRDVHDRPMALLSIVSLTQLALNDGRIEQAAKLFGAAEAMISNVGQSLTAKQRSTHERNYERLSGAEPQPELIALRAHGRSLDFNRVIDLAIESCELLTADPN